MAGIAGRTVVFVLGMHRSGTSVTTAILNALGVALSEDLMPPTPANAMGYFESKSISDLHDELLRVLGSAWNTPLVFSPFPEHWWRRPEIAAIKSRLKAFVAEELQRTDGAWGFKDPRTARLLPLWFDIVAELGLDARYLLVVREPQDVAKSLLARENMHPMMAELLWLEHNASAIKDLGNRLGPIVEYRRWFSDPLEQARYMIRELGFPVPDDAEIERALSSLVSSELRHHAAAEPEYHLPYTREMYGILAGRDRSSAAMLADLFEVTRTFANKMAVYVAQDRAAAISGLERQLRTLHEERSAG